MQRSGLGKVTLALVLAAALPVWVLAQTPPTTAPAQPQQAPQTPAPASDPASPAPDSPAPATPAPATSDPAPADQTDAAQEPGAETSSLELVRKSDKDGKERRIRIVRTGTSDTTGIFAVCGAQDGDPEDAPNLAVFSETGPGGVRITIDQNVIRVPLAVVTQQQPKDGQDGSDGRVEASAGSARFLDDVPEGAKERLTRCGVEASPKPAPDTVFVTQGKTELKGQKLVYDETDGIARIDGPVTFERDNDKDPLTGTSEKIEVNVDDEKTTLVGNVVLRSAGGRVSKAGRVEYDDAANMARLIGTAEQPAESVKNGTETIRAGMILYDLDKNEVYAVKAEGGTITGEFVEGDTPETAPAPEAVPGSSPPTTPKPSDPNPPPKPDPDAPPKP